MSKKIKIILLLICMLTLTGCWDRVESENRAFVMVTGIDKYDPEKSKTSEKHKPKENENNRFKMTYIFPKFTAIKTGEEGANSRELISSVGRTPYEITRQLTVRGDSQPFFQHMKATVLGVDIVKNSEYFLEILDALERQDEISRKIHLFIAEDQASEILAVESMLKPLSYKLQGMTQSRIGTSLFIPKTLEEVISSTIQGATLIPRITASKTEIKVAGSAVIKHNKFIGWLGEKETKAVSFLTGAANQDIIQIYHHDVTMPYIIKKIKVKRSARVEDGVIVMDINLTTRGNIQQYSVEKSPRLTDIAFLEELESVIDRRISDKLNVTINKLQNDMNVDVIDIGEYLKGHEPDIWDEVKDDWNEVFKEVKINVSVDSHIEKIGAIK